MSTKGWLVVGITLLAAAGTVRAHHSFAAQFDVDKIETVVGTITKMDWVSPHAWLYIDAKDASGQVQAWTVEFSSANALYQRGWRKQDLPVGSTVSVTGYRSRNPAVFVLSAREVKLPEGRTLFEGKALEAN